MTVHEIKSFFHIEEVQQSSSMKVRYCWEIRLAYYKDEGYYGYAYTTFNRDEIKWIKLDTLSQEEAVKRMLYKCRTQSK